MVQLEGLKIDREGRWEISGRDERRKRRRSEVDRRGGERERENWMEEP